MADSASGTAKPPGDPARFVLEVKRSRAGHGLFAGEPIPRGALITEYIGPTVIAADHRNSRSRYLFEVGGNRAIDGSPRWNRARYINHACKPNCRIDIRRRRVFIYAIRAIRRGEELNYDYGSEYFDALIGPNCRCLKCAPEAREPGRKSRNRGKSGAQGRNRTADT